MARAAALALMLALALPAPVRAADPAALAAIRADMVQLNAEIQALRRELDAQAASSATQPVTGAPVVLRLDRIETEMRALTGQVEGLAHRIGRIAEDGTRRLQDLEFRLVELEGGDLSAIGTTPLLGGETDKPVAGFAVASTPATDSGPSLAVAEKSDFERALGHLEDGDTTSAIEGLRKFLGDYPGGPLAAEAMFHLGEAESAEGQHKLAARAFLDSFTAAPAGPFAAKSLMRVGVALDALGQKPEACQTLAEVLARFPADPVAPETQSKLTAIGCQ